MGGVYISGEWKMYVSPLGSRKASTKSDTVCHVPEGGNVL